MAIRTRVLESGLCEITENYIDDHGGIDLVREGYRLDNITANSDGTVNVYYRVRTINHRWLPEVKNLDDYAGGFRINVIKLQIESIFYFLF